MTNLNDIIILSNYIMDGFKIVLVLIVVFFICCLTDKIQTFIPGKHVPQYREIQGLPFTNEPMDGKLYMCKDKNDIIGSCHGIGVIPEVFDKYKDSNTPCPFNWLTPGNSIYK